MFKLCSNRRNRIDMSFPKQFENVEAFFPSSGSLLQRVPPLFVGRRFLLKRPNMKFQNQSKNVLKIWTLNLDAPFLSWRKWKSESEIRQTNLNAQSLVELSATLFERVCQQRGQARAWQMNDDRVVRCEARTPLPQNVVLWPGHLRSHCCRRQQRLRVPQV